MSTDILTVIPTEPGYVPTAAAQRRARELLASFVPQARDVCAVVTVDIQFVDQGANWERIACPACGAVWCDDARPCAWWQRAMDAAWATRFTNLTVTMPCCGAASSLNDLRYDWPAGFARFRLVAREPSIAALDAVMIAALERAVAHPLRVVRARY